MQQFFPIVSSLKEFLHHANEKLRTASVEGFAKTLLFNALNDNNVPLHLPSFTSQVLFQILETLALELFNPVTENQLELKKCLRLFFPQYVASSIAHQKQMEESITVIISTLLCAPMGSSLNKIKLSELASYFFRITDPQTLNTLREEGKIRILEEEGEVDKLAHNRLANSLLKEILASPIGREGIEIPSILNLLHLSPEDKESIMNLRLLTEKALSHVNDKTALKSLEKFKQTLLGMNDDPLLDGHSSYPSLFPFSRSLKNN